MGETQSPLVIHGPTKGAVILFIASIVATVVLVVAGTWYAIIKSNASARADTASVLKQVSASCDFWKQLGSVPIAPVPPLKAPSKFGVQIVLSSVEAYDGFGCGKLMPSPELIRWAGYYHLPLP